MKMKAPNQNKKDYIDDEVSTLSSSSSAAPPSPTNKRNMYHQHPQFYRGSRPKNKLLNYTPYDKSKHAASQKKKKISRNSIYKSNNSNDQHSPRGVESLNHLKQTFGAEDTGKNENLSSLPKQQLNSNSSTTSHHVDGIPTAIHIDIGSFQNMHSNFSSCRGTTIVENGTDVECGEAEELDEMKRFEFQRFLHDIKNDTAVLDNGNNELSHKNKPNMNDHGKGIFKSISKTSKPISEPSEPNSSKNVDTNTEVNVDALSSILKSAELSGREMRLARLRLESSYRLNASLGLAENNHTEIQREHMNIVDQKNYDLKVADSHVQCKRTTLNESNELTRKNSASNNTSIHHNKGSPNHNSSDNSRYCGTKPIPSNVNGDCHDNNYDVHLAKSVTKKKAKNNTTEVSTSYMSSNNYHDNTIRVSPQSLVQGSTASSNCAIRYLQQSQGLQQGQRIQHREQRLGRRRRRLEQKQKQEALITDTGVVDCKELHVDANNESPINTLSSVRVKAATSTDLVEPHNKTSTYRRQYNIYKARHLTKKKNWCNTDKFSTMIMSTPPRVGTCERNQYERKKKDECSINNDQESESTKYTKNVQRPKVMSDISCPSPLVINNSFSNKIVNTNKINNETNKSSAESAASKLVTGERRNAGIRARIHRSFWSVSHCKHNTDTKQKWKNTTKANTNTGTSQIYPVTNSYGDKCNQHEIMQCSTQPVTPSTSATLSTPTSSTSSTYFGAEGASFDEEGVFVSDYQDSSGMKINTKTNVDDIEEPPRLNRVSTTYLSKSRPIKKKINNQKKEFSFSNDGDFIEEEPPRINVDKFPEDEVETCQHEGNAESISVHVTEPNSNKICDISVGLGNKSTKDAHVTDHGEIIDLKNAFGKKKVTSSNVHFEKLTPKDGKEKDIGFVTDNSDCKELKKELNLECAAMYIKAQCRTFNDTNGGDRELKENEELNEFLDKIGKSSIPTEISIAALPHSNTTTTASSDGLAQVVVSKEKSKPAIHDIFENYEHQTITSNSNNKSSSTESSSDIIADIDSREERITISQTPSLDLVEKSSNTSLEVMSSDNKSNGSECVLSASGKWSRKLPPKLNDTQTDETIYTRIRTAARKMISGKSSSVFEAKTDTEVLPDTMLRNENDTEHLLSWNEQSVFCEVVDGGGKENAMSDTITFNMSLFDGTVDFGRKKKNQGGMERGKSRTNLMNSNLESSDLSFFSKQHHGIDSQICSYIEENHKDCGRREEKISIVEYSKSLRSKLLLHGKNYLSLTSSLEKVGLQLYESGHYSDALSHFEEAFIIKRKIYGMDNSDVACSLNNIGCAQYGSGSHKKGLISLKDALSIMKIETNRMSFLEEGSLFREATTKLNIGHIYLNSNNFGAAVSAYNESLTILKMIMGQEHDLCKSTERKLMYAEKKQLQSTKKSAFLPSSTELSLSSNQSLSTFTIPASGFSLFQT